MARSWLFATMIAGALVTAPAAFGLTVGEVGDAPAILPGMSTMGNGPLTLIYGTLDSADVDVYRIQVTNPASFSATLIGGAGFDTQLFLFGPGGLGVVHDDDEPPGDLLQSTITGAFLPGPGIYSLAISEFDRDPVNPLASLIWLDSPADVERVPDGPGAPGPLTGWSGAATGRSREYWIQLTGCTASNPGPGPPGIWQEAGDAPDLIAGQQTAGLGSLNRIFGTVSDSVDADLYAIRITDPVNFSATSAGDVEEDTQLFLFDSAGNGVAFDDDWPGESTTLSRLTSGFVAGAGTYYLGISEFSRNPASAFGSIWFADPFFTERAPDGPGAPGPLASWPSFASSSGGYYAIRLTGAEFALGNAGAEEARSPGTQRVSLEARPNPFRRTATVSYSIPEAGPVRLRVLDLRGALVRTLVDDPRSGPAKSVPWDGRDERGAAVGAGLYLIRLEAGAATSNYKIVLTR